jgi:type II secretory pathway pseudopilin PulG
MSVINKKNTRGDTLIEVLLAAAVFSLVAIGTLAIMNQGTATAQKALEISFVRNEIDAQAEALRFMNASYISSYQPGVSSYSDSGAEQWLLMRNYIASTGLTDTSPFGSSSGSCPAIRNTSFIINAKRALFVNPLSGVKPSSATTFSQVVYDGSDNITPGSVNGIWIEALMYSPGALHPYQTNAGYIDFHIYACWDSPSQSAPITLGTIVRLYEPQQ